MTRFHLRWLVVLATTSSILLVSPPSAAAGPVCREIFGGKTLNWIIPHDVGGGFDAYSRLIGPVYADLLGLEVRFQNVTGAGGRIGAQRLKEAPPDGLTVGILNGPGLLVASMLKDKVAPNPATDFTILARIARSAHVWVVAEKATIRSINELLPDRRTTSVVFGVRDLGSVGFISMVVGAHLLGLTPEYVAGYKGTRHVVLALARGEVDVVSKSFESFRKRIEQGALRPVIQISAQPVSSHASLSGVPLLGGKDGLAVRRARILKRDPTIAQTDAETLAALVGAGRLIAAPLGLSKTHGLCMQAALATALNDPGLRARAGKMKRTLEPARGDAARADLQTAIAAADRFLPVIQQAVKQLQRGPNTK